MPHKTWTGEWQMRLLPRTHLRVLWFSLLMTSWPADIAQTTLNFAKTPMKLANCLGNMGQRSEHTTSFPSSTSEFIKHGSLSVQIQMDLKGRQLSISESHFVVAGNLSGKIIGRHIVFGHFTTKPSTCSILWFAPSKTLLSHPFSTFWTDRSSLSYRFDGHILPRM